MPPFSAEVFSSGPSPPTPQGGLGGMAQGVTFNFVGPSKTKGETTGPGSWVQDPGPWGSPVPRALEKKTSVRGVLGRCDWGATLLCLCGTLREVQGVKVALSRHRALATRWAAEWACDLPADLPSDGV